MNSNARRLYGNLGPRTGQLVSSNPADLLRRVDRRHLVQLSVEDLGQALQLAQRSYQRLRGGGRGAFGIKGVGGEAKTDTAFVMFLRLTEELGKARVSAQQKR